jgi:hypothetical protein
MFNVYNLCLSYYILLDLYVIVLRNTCVMIHVLFVTMVHVMFRLNWFKLEYDLGFVMCCHVDV